MSKGQKVLSVWLVVSYIVTYTRWTLVFLAGLGAALGINYHINW